MKAIFRNFQVTLQRFRLASILNLLGLSVAFAAFIIILIQVRYERTFDTSYKKSGRIYRIESTLIPTESNLSSREAYSSFLARPLIEMLLPSAPRIADVATSDWPVGFLDYYLYTYSKSPQDEDIMYYFIPVSYNFTEMMGIEIIEGRNFDKTDQTAPGEKLLLNELAARQFNVKPGDKLANGSQVIGIIKDFHFMNLRKKIEPMALTSGQSQNPILQPTLYIRTTGNAYAAIKKIKDCIAEIDPLYPVEIKFYDQLFEQAYQKERNTSVQISMFSLLTIIISLMGVFGLVTFETQYRRKEISIRKIMGATVTEILVIFYKKFAWIVFVSFLLAAPVAWYGLNKWLQAFAYRTTLQGWIFILSLLIVLIITFVTVTLQSWLVATSDPVHSLKSE